MPTPPSGAIIDYYLKAAATGAPTLEIVDSSGTTVAQLLERSAACRRPRDAVFRRTSPRSGVRCRFRFQARQAFTG